jgi:hypothetical protein
MPDRQCECGCGEPLEGAGQQRFVNDAHRKRASRRRRRRWRPWGQDPDIATEPEPEAPPAPARDPFDEDEPIWRTWP